MPEQNATGYLNPPAVRCFSDRAKGPGEYVPLKKVRTTGSIFIFAFLGYFNINAFIVAASSSTNKCA